MITGNKDIMKLIYEIQDNTLMLIFNMYERWTIGHNITFIVFDCDYHGSKVGANGNALSVLEGMANYMINEDADTPRHCKTFGEWF